MKERANGINSSLQDALMKKALGYSHTEVVEEFVSGEEGEIKLNKKKITTKTDPPDITAIKILIDGSKSDLETLTDAQLEEEKQRLLALLEKGGKKKRRTKNEQG